MTQEMAAAITRGDLQAVLNLLEMCDKAECRIITLQAIQGAICTDNPHIALTLLDRDVNVNTPAYRFLSYAANKDQHEVAQVLLNKGANVNAASHIGETALMAAAEVGSVEMTRLLLDAGAAVNAGADVDTTSNYSPGTAVQHALKNGRRYFDVVKLLIERGADPNQEVYQVPILLFAAKSGASSVVRALLAQGAAVNATDGRFGNTALILAAYEGHTEIVVALLEAGADPNQTNESGHTALERASFYNHVSVIEQLLYHGADIREENEQNEEALTRAAFSSKPDMLRLLLAYGANANTKRFKDPLLILAIKEGNRETSAEIVQMLLEHGADPNRPGDHGWTAWHWAIALNRDDIAALLQAFGADSQATAPLLISAETIRLNQTADLVETFRIQTKDNQSVPGENIVDFQILKQGETKGIELAAKIYNVLSDYKTYMGYQSLCIFDPGVAFRLHSQTAIIQLLVCFKCCEIMIVATQIGRKIEKRIFPFSHSYHAVVALAQEAFPEDPEIAALSSNSQAL